MPKLTKRAVDALRAAHSATDALHWDDELPGFGMRLKPSGAASWVIQYRNRRGSSRRLTLGQVGRLTPDEARKEARAKLAAVDRGKDPAQERDEERQAVTVSELCEQYLTAARVRVKPSTLENDRSRIKGHIVPLLGRKTVRDLRSTDIERFFRDVIEGKTAKKVSPDKAGKTPKGGRITGGPGAACRALDLLGTVLQRAVRDGMLVRNPAFGIERPKRNPVKPPFSFKAVEKVGSALRKREELESKNAIRSTRLLLLTGCRRMEMLTLRWRMVDAGAHCLRFDDTKTGPQIRPVGRAALDILASFKPKSCKADAYVFPGSGEHGHFVGLPKAWGRIAKAAEIEGVSVHGLRHWFASAAAEMGYSELIIAPLLGHSGRGITSRYANAPDTALIAAADRISQRLADALEGKTERKVLQLSRA
ncbi:MAG: tyrosine-type recombinase/integrase [Alphaproteobacteria bacterium]